MTSQADEELRSLYRGWMYNLSNDLELGHDEILARIRDACNRDRPFYQRLIAQHYESNDQWRRVDTMQRLLRLKLGDKLDRVSRDKPSSQ
jgi:hypothetical protein